jgi:hypothetical protein
MTTLTFNSALYDFTQNLQGALWGAALAQDQASAATPAPPPPLLLQVRAGYAESPGWFMAQAAEFDPEPLTVERLRVRAIWSAPGLVKALLELMASEQWLDRVGEEYTLTDAGRELLRSRQALRAERFRAARIGVPDADVLRAERLLDRIIVACLNAPTPPGSWCVQYSRRRAPEASTSTLDKLIHHISDLNAFRDDAHMAAWRAHGVEGYEWETFTHVVRGLANDAKALFTTLAYRGYALHEFRMALGALTQRGWIAAEGQAYQVTEQGRSVHDDAERLTDTYFFAPWSALTEPEQTELHTLLKQLEAATQPAKTE